MLRDKVILVNEHDQPLGVADKMEAHLKGLLHRAFSVFIFNSKGEMLIHQRAATKYHGAGLWTNACCSHPQWGENIVDSARERLQYEMGLDCEISKLYEFVYKVQVENNLMEHEYDHVFVGYSDASPSPRANEVQNFLWLDTTTILNNIQRYPTQYTYWFRQIAPEIIARIDHSVAVHSS